MAKWKDFIEWQLIHYPLHKAFLEKYDEGEWPKHFKSKLKQKAVLHKTNLVADTPIKWEIAYIKQIKLRKKNILWYVDIIENTLEQLSPLDQKIVKMRYFDSLEPNTVKICTQLYLSHSHYYRHLNRILYIFAAAFGLSIDKDNLSLHEKIEITDTVEKTIKSIKKSSL